MATLSDALELVRDRDYVVRWGSPPEAMRELRVELIVDELKRRGAASDDHARALAREAAEHIGGHGAVVQRVGGRGQPGELRLWIPASALHT